MNTENKDTINAIETMSETQPNDTSSEKKRCQHSCGKHAHGHRGRRWKMIALLIGAGLIGGLVARGCAHERWAGHRGGMSGMHERGGFGGKMDAGKMMERVADKVNANAEQKQKLNEIAKKFDEGQTDKRAQMQAARQKAVELLSADPVDTAAVEQLRASQVAQMDEQSKRVSQALIEAAQVLSPEQRQQLAKMMPQSRW